VTNPVTALSEVFNAESSCNKKLYDDDIDPLPPASLHVSRSQLFGYDCAGQKSQSSDCYTELLALTCAVVVEVTAPWFDPGCGQRLFATAL
jgi:hypothetical protein